MNEERHIDLEKQRAERLLEFVKGELRNMYVGARLWFTDEIVKYLEPELIELSRKSDAKD